MTVCQQNLHHTQKLQKQANNKGIKPQSYAPGDKVWLSSKHLKTKRNRKLEAKFPCLFRVLHPVGKQAYKLKLPKKQRIHKVFHVSLLEQNTTKKGRVNNTQLDFEFEVGDNKEYEVNSIWDSAVYAKESTTGQLPGLYYLVLQKGYPEEENTWEPTSAIQHLQRLITAYHKDNLEKPTATSAPVNTASPIARPSTPPRPTTNSTTDISIKRKRGQLAGSTTIKQAKKSQTSFLLDSLSVFLLKKYLTCRLGDFFTNHTLWIFRFSSSVLQLGQEVFHQSILYLPHRTPRGQEYNTQESGFSFSPSYLQAGGFFIHSTKQIPNNVDRQCA